MKKLLPLILISYILVIGAGTSMVKPIKAENNSGMHNQIGLQYLRERYYFGAIKEFQIAISINPNTQATAVYYNNLGRTYMEIEYPVLASECFEKAINQYPLDFSYYQNLINSYQKAGILDKKLNYIRANRKNYTDDIKAALIYAEKGDIRTATTILDDFCQREPELLIIPALQKYIKEINSSAPKFVEAY